MRKMTWLLGPLLVLSGCAMGSGGFPLPGGPDGDVVVVGDDREGRSRDGGVYTRSVEVPRGHYPPPGECRVWYYGREPGHQPPPGRCSSLVGRVPLGALLLYNEKAWDTEHDWRGQESRRHGSVPEVVLRIMGSLVRNRDSAFTLRRRTGGGGTCSRQEGRRGAGGRGGPGVVSPSRPAPRRTGQKR